MPRDAIATPSPVDLSARDQGTGLGLSASHGIVEEHGGALRVESQRGVGSRFSIGLPAGED